MGGMGRCVVVCAFSISIVHICGWWWTWILDPLHTLIVWQKFKKLFFYHVLCTAYIVCGDLGSKRERLAIPFSSIELVILPQFRFFFHFGVIFFRFVLFCFASNVLFFRRFYDIQETNANSISDKRSHKSRTNRTFAIHVAEYKKKEHFPRLSNTPMYSRKCKALSG